MTSRCAQPFSWMTLSALIVLSHVPPVAGADARASGTSIVLTTPQCCANAEWSTFKKGADRVGRTGRIGPQTAHVQWDHSLFLDDIQSPAAIAADGTIYAGSVTGRFYAFRPDGTLKWTRKLSRFEITSGPAVGQDGTVYVAPENSYLYALDPNGAVKWRFPKVGNGGPSASPVIGNGGTIYIGANFFYAVRSDGTLRWKYDTGSIISGPPAIGADGTIYFPSNYHLYALNPDGSLKWSLADQAAYPLGSAPAVGADGTIYANTNDGVLHAIRPNGTLRWKFTTEGIVVDVPSSPAIALDGTVYFGGGGEYMGMGGYFYAVRPVGTLKWKYFAGCDQTAPSIGGDGTIYFGSDSCGAIHALNPDGTPKWSYFKSAYTRSAPAIGRGQRLYTGYLADPNFSQNGGLLSIGP